VHPDCLARDRNFHPFLSAGNPCTCLAASNGGYMDAGFIQQEKEIIEDDAQSQ
jgi:hypothetical protein